MMGTANGTSTAFEGETWGAHETAYENPYAGAALEDEWGSTESAASWEDEWGMGESSHYVGASFEEEWATQETSPFAASLEDEWESSFEGGYSTEAEWSPEAAWSPEYSFEDETDEADPFLPFLAPLAIKAGAALAKSAAAKKLLPMAMRAAIRVAGRLASA